MSFPETSLSLSLKDALQQRNDVTEKIELSLKMVENEDIYEMVFDNPVSMTCWQNRAEHKKNEV